MSILTRKIKVKGKFGSAPPLLCSIVQLSIFFESNASSVITDNNVVVTNTTAAQGTGLYTAVNDVLVNVEDNILVAEITINSLSSMTDGSASLNYGETNFNVNEGFVIEANTGVGDGIIRRISDSSIVLSGLTLTIPLTAQLITNGSTGDVSYNDGVNSTLLSNIPTIGTIDGTFVTAILPPTGLNETEDVTLNLGSEPMKVTPPPDSKFHCELTQVP